MASSLKAASDTRCTYLLYKLQQEIFLCQKKRSNPTFEFYGWFRICPRGFRGLSANNENILLPQRKIQI